MAHNESHERRTHRVTDFEHFPPTVVGHSEYANGIELELLDPGTAERPRFIWIPDDPNEETEYAL